MRLLKGFDTKSALEIARIINHEDSKIAAAVKKAIPEIAAVIDQVARCLRDGGRLIYIGAGSSGRIAALDASECPPTYSTAPGQVQYIMAGGPRLWLRLLRSMRIQKSWASGISPGAAQHARIWLSGSPPLVAPLMLSPQWPMPAPVERIPPPSPAIMTRRWQQRADIAIVADVGAEVISGSTRMKAGSAQKMILNMITTGAMTRMGYVYENLMVNVHMQNSKLVERGIRILMCACKIDRETAVHTIKSAGRSVPVALVMLKARVDKPEAVRRLAKCDGNVRLAIEDNVLEL